MRKLFSCSAALLAALTFFPTDAAADKTFDVNGTSGTALRATEVATFDEPWAMTFLPDGTLLVTTRPGKLFHVTQEGDSTEVSGVWEVAYGGQGGLGDVVPHPDFESNGLVYFSSAETLDQGSTFGAVVARARLDLSGNEPKLVDLEKLWTQEPKLPGQGHYGHRIAFGPDGMLYITAGDRQKQQPAQDLDQALGKVIRLHDDGRTPSDNPWQDEGELAKTFWSMGHRNLLGIDFDADGRLWTHEMGPAHGDELNVIVAGENYGWPIVSDGDNYSGLPIPDHSTRSEFRAPATSWVPAISPAGFVIYDGDLFGDWRGDGFIGGLSSKALIRVDLQGEKATEAERYEWGERIREVEQGPDGSLWVLEDESGARLLKLTPR